MGMAAEGFSGVDLEADAGQSRVEFAGLEKRKMATLNLPPPAYAASDFMPQESPCSSSVKSTSSAIPSSIYTESEEPELEAHRSSARLVHRMPHLLRRCGSAQAVFLSHFLVALALATGDIIHSAEIGLGRASLAVTTFALHVVLALLLLFSGMFGRRLTCARPIWPAIVSLQWALVYISSVWRQDLSSGPPDQGDRFAALGAFMQLLHVFLYPVGCVASFISAVATTVLLCAMSSLSSSEGWQTSRVLENALLVLWVGFACTLLTSGDCNEVFHGVPPLIRSDLTAKLTRVAFEPLLTECDKTETSRPLMETRLQQLQKQLIKSKVDLELSILSAELAEVLVDVVDKILQEIGSADSIDVKKPHDGSSAMNHFVADTFNPNLTQAALIAQNESSFGQRRNSVLTHGRSSRGSRGSAACPWRRDGSKPSTSEASRTKGGNSDADSDSSDKLAANGLPLVVESATESSEGHGYTPNHACARSMGDLRHQASNMSFSYALCSWKLLGPDGEVGGYHQPDYDGSIEQLMGVLKYTEEGPTPEVDAFEELEVDGLRRVGKWDFDMFALATSSQNDPLVLVGLKGVMPLLDELDLRSDRVATFFKNLAVRYHSSNPYHNSWHGADVFNNLLYFFNLKQATGSCGSTVIAVPHLEKFSALMAAASHDVGHDGKANRYHIMVGSPLSLLYNDKSVLESMHCAIVFALLQVEDCDFLLELDVASKATFRSIVVGMILETDLAVHMQVLTKFRQELVPAEFDNAEKVRSDLGDMSAANRLILISMILKFCDVGHSAKPFALHTKWSLRITAEFYAQGDAERDLRIPCSPFCDRYGGNIAESQRGFFDFIVAPISKALDAVLGCSQLKMEVLSDITRNQKFWKNFSRDDFNYEDAIENVSLLQKEYATQSATLNGRRLSAACSSNDFERMMKDELGKKKSMLHPLRDHMWRNHSVTPQRDQRAKFRRSFSSVNLA